MKVGGIIFATVLYPAFLFTFMLISKEDAFVQYYALCMILPIFFGFWAIVSLHLRTIWCILLLAILLYIHDWWSVGIVFVVFLLIHLVLSRTITKEAVSIASPSLQRLYAYQGGNTFLVDHHWRHPVQRNALDLVGIGTSGRRARGFFPKD